MRGAHGITGERRIKFTDTKYEIGKDIFITSRILHRYVDARLDRNQVSSCGQGKLLGMVVCETDMGRELYQKDIEAEFHIRGASATNMLQLMEKNGLIIRERSSADSRLKSIVPTAAGRRVHEQIRSAIEGAERDLLAQLSQEEIEIFKSVMLKLRSFAANEQGGNSAC